jgi:putative ATP-binding cassette transporter
MRIAEKIRCAEVQFIENIGRSRIQSQLTEGSNTISDASLPIINSSQGVIVIVVTLLYIAWLSLLTFMVVTIVLTLGIAWSQTTNKQKTAELHAATNKQIEFFSLLTQMLDGFKEIKINQRKSDDLFQEVNIISSQHEHLKTKVSIQSVTLIMTSRVTFYLLLGLVVFILSSWDLLDKNSVFKLTASILFIIGPLNMIVLTLPILTRTNVALKNLYDLEEQLDTAISNQLQLSRHQLDKFQELHLSKIVFHYLDKEHKPLFSIGPINLTIQRGELLFMVGGNGSGKSTLLKLLTGLYYPISGAIYVDDEEIEHTEYQCYRELFAIIFTDFHLFDKLYGLPEIDRKRVKSWLRLMELDEKTKYQEGKFSHLDLSTGQKKRLAFIVAMLEDKPIYVFDELAADQDPGFRKKFYEELLPDLKKQGKTIIVVTHDDKYFHVADRILKMEYGQLVNYEDRGM